MTIRTILLAADFSRPARAAAYQARLLAGHFSAELKLIHVLPYPLAIPGAPDYGSKLGEWFTGRSEQDALALRSALAEELKDIDLQYIVLEGDPPKRIAEYADSHDVDLIVMPAYGQGPFRRFLLGSVTAKVLHDVECPVWTGVHREELPFCGSLDIRTVVCAISQESQNAKLVRWASEAAASFHARLFLVHVVPALEPVIAESAPSGFIDSIEARAREYVAALAGQCGVEPEIVIARGEVPQAVCAELERLDADLLIIGRSPQSAMFGRLPTNAYAIVRDSRCPVVSV